MKNLLIILKPFEDATKNLSGDSYCSASLVVRITNGLINAYSKIKVNEYPHKIMSVVSKTNLDRLSNVEYNDIVGITKFFDPRFKTFAFYRSGLCRTH